MEFEGLLQGISRSTHKLPQESKTVLNNAKMSRWST